MAGTKTVLVTGASRGIGAAVARQFAEMGYNTIINCAGSFGQALALARELSQRGANALALKADVADRAAVEQMFEQIRALFGGVDILINNAGIAQQKLFTDITAQEWERMLAVNLTGAFNCTQCALPYMISQKSGSIVNISSIWGISGASCEVHYSAAKAGLIGMTKALAQELGPSGIRVNCVAPGVVATDMNSALSDEDMLQICEQTPLGSIATPEMIANSICFLASDGSGFTTGQVLSPNGGLVV